MEIEKIYPPYIYSVKYDGEDVNEFERLFEDWRNLDEVMDFFKKSVIAKVIFVSVISIIISMSILTYIVVSNTFETG